MCNHIQYYSMISVLCSQFVLSQRCSGREWAWARIFLCDRSGPCQDCDRDNFMTPEEAKDHRPLLVGVPQDSPLEHRLTMISNKSFFCPKSGQLGNWSCFDGHFECRGQLKGIGGCLLSWFDQSHGNGSEIVKGSWMVQLWHTIPFWLPRFCWPLPTHACNSGCPGPLTEYDIPEAFPYG